MDYRIKKESIKCDLCGSNGKSFLFRSKDFRFGNLGWFDFVKCKKCGLIYLDPRPTKKSLLSIYCRFSKATKTDYVEYSKRNPLWKKKLRPIWHRFSGLYSVFDLKEKGTFLDVGCGTGDTLEFARDIGFEAYGIELNPNMIEICEEKGLDVYDLSSEETLFSRDSFDIIWMSQVLEHLPSPRKTLKEMRRILKPSGQLLLFCPNADSYLSRLFGKYWNGWFVPFHFYVFNEMTIRVLASKTGFKIETFKTSTPDRHFIVSLKSVLWEKTKNRKKFFEYGRLLDTMASRGIISIFLRSIDSILPERGDCIKAVFKK